MKENEISLLVKFLVELRSENLALRKVILQQGPIGAAGLDALSLSFTRNSPILELRGMHGRCWRPMKIELFA
jgi:hypothetical protein